MIKRNTKKGADEPRGKPIRETKMLKFQNNKQAKPEAKPFKRKAKIFA